MIPMDNPVWLAKELAECRRKNADMLAALRESIGIIRTFHGPQAWDIYHEHSPEMKRLRAAIAAAEGK